MTEPISFRISEAQDLLGVSDDKFRQWAKEVRLPIYAVGTARMILTEEYKAKLREYPAPSEAQSGGKLGGRNPLEN